MLELLRGIQDWIVMQAASETPVIPGVPIALAIAVALLPIFMAIFSRRFGIFLASLVLSALAFIVFERPGLTILAVSASALLGSAVVALIGWGARRRTLRTESIIAELREGQRDLRLSEERRRLLELKVGTLGLKPDKGDDASDHS